MNSNIPQDKRVFLSGTDRAIDVLSIVADVLPSLGFEPVWFHLDNFPVVDENAMDACIEAVQYCGRIVLVLDERAGLPHKGSGVTISEAEFNRAHSLGLRKLVFVRSKIWHQARVFHRQTRKRGRSLTDQEFEDCCLDGDHEVYRFIERLQHLTRGDRAAVPWISPFDIPRDVVSVIRGKWLLNASEQLDVLELLKDTIAKDSLAGAQRSTPSGRAFHVSDQFSSQVATAAAEHRRALLEAWSGILHAVTQQDSLPPDLIPIKGSANQFLLIAGEFMITVEVTTDSVTVLKLTHMRELSGPAA